MQDLLADSAEVGMRPHRVHCSSCFIQRVIQVAQSIQGVKQIEGRNLVVRR
jgi:hypothetical protein